MIAAPTPPEEAARLLDLARYHVLDTAREEPFNRITRLAARILRTPVAVINFVDQYRQWGKAMVGLTDTEAPREQSFCAWTIGSDQPFVVENATTDPRFHDNPMVTGDPHIHMYAGAPLTTPAGHRIGTLCVTHYRPHPLSSEDLQSLQDLAALAMQELELRRSLLDAARAVDAQRRQAEELRQVLDHTRVVEGISSLMDLDLPFEDALETAASLVSDAIAADFTAVLIRSGEGYTVKVPRAGRAFPETVKAAAASLLSGDTGVLGTLGTITAPVYLSEYAAFPQALPVLVEAGVQRVAYVPLGTGDDRPVMLVMRLRGPDVPDWRTQDKALLEVAGRTVAHALRRQAALEHAQGEARVDGLTALLNRRAFDEDLRAAWAQAAAVHLAVIDVDGLKRVNDTEGHAQGDKLLRVFGQALKAETAAHGQVYRLGGDEFAVLSQEPPDVLLKWVEVAMRVARQTVLAPVGASVGVASKAESDTLEQWLSLADSRMYDMKRRLKSML
ncbi:sensor domain-containing diguanylate cyclase [Deinococcus soli (ex Cha et al. 2016)]|uniref:sensor domain-containing diguanylate cyclase n=1 Tax=Deinococcus soli (ex Cha et al. 2016) TaxID=1309411 RepID=UPI00166977C8|nr:sensor domain-containing diguanylate cyclase [Deinococcus soli (ex Cha et al. 2016)]